MRLRNVNDIRLMAGFFGVITHLVFIIFKQMEDLKKLLLEWEFIVNEISDFVDKVIDGQITNKTDNIQEFCGNLYSKADNILERIDSLNKDKSIWSDDEYKQFQLIDCNLKNSIEKLKNFFNKGRIC